MVDTPTVLSKRQTDAAAVAARRGAERILQLLTGAGFEAYIVGGAVRDILMGRTPHDYDIVTSARPDDVIRVVRANGFTAGDPVGKSFGVVIAVVPEGAYEIATYRSERYGADSHRPEEVTYADTLEEDVQRRDFTVNGMAMDIHGAIIDLVGGQADLKKRRLRTIGKAEARFQEDALRMFRACRFIGKLDFLPDRSLLDGMAPNFQRVSGLSLERVRAELDGLLLTPAVAKGLDVLVQSRLAECTCKITDNGVVTTIPILPELYHLVNLPQEKAFHAFDGWYHTLAVVAATPADLTLRWAALLHDVAKGMPGIRAIRHDRLTDYGHDTEGARMTVELLTRLRYPAAFVKRVAWLVQSHMRFHYFVNNQEANAHKWMRKEVKSGLFRTSDELATAVKQLAAVCAADVVGCGRPNSVTDGTWAMGDCLAAIADELPIHTRDLHYDSDFPRRFGADTGDMLRYLLERVRSGSVPNEPKALAAAAEQRRQRLARVKATAATEDSERE